MLYSYKNNVSEVKGILSTSKVLKYYYEDMSLDGNNNVMPFIIRDEYPNITEDLLLRTK